MYNFPLVSVVLPVYNAEKSIDYCLKSVLEQSYKNIEVIVINDGSTDRSEEIIQTIIKKYPEKRIKYISQENKGVSVARNLGLKKALGEFIAFIDSDDEWLPTKLEEQMKVFDENNKVDIISCNRNQEHFDSFLGNKFKVLQRIPAKMLFLKNFALTPTVVMKREAFHTVGYFNENMRYAEDLIYFVRLAHHHHLYLLNKSLVITGKGKMSFGESGLSSNLWEMEKGELKGVSIARKLGIINTFESLFFYTFSFLKYLRRVFISKVWIKTNTTSNKRND
ncbi:glycosyltransferase family A protein [Mesonia sp. K7]|uniref:glycosyltransferase family 2 protein n=1 Tax=Mesonia sp. K7 TaxID=2218606 RepID=UPI000DA6E5EE|nr:glycosyltransferase family A protein [Mesonia sp. K7]PZD79110.1 glycosyltransferase family 2 protein [Mesonia sp. K7]